MNRICLIVESLDKSEVTRRDVEEAMNRAFPYMRTRVTQAELPPVIVNMDYPCAICGSAENWHGTLIFGHQYKPAAAPAAESEKE